MHVDFYYDIVCPFAYLASTRIAALAEEAGASLSWRPVLLGGLLKDHGAPTVPMHAMAAPKLRLTHLDMVRQADLLGQPLRIPRAHPRRTVNAMRLLVAVDEARRPALTADLYRAYWVEGRDVADPAVLQEVAAAYDLDVEQVRADPAVRDGLREATAAARDRGVFGVPTTVVGDTLAWGVDRLHLAREALGLPREPAPSPGRGGRLELFHDFSSPFSYLATTQAEALAEAHGAELVLTPILLGALFREIGTPMVPMHSFHEVRQRWTVRDLQDHARWYGVPFRFPSTFPLRTVTALRVALLEPAATAPLYRAAWADDRDIGDPDVLRGVLDDAGLPGAELIARTSEPEVKARLKANTDRAREVGACGVPTFLVNGEHLFWGQDRLDQVARALSGWTPPAPSWS